MYLEKHYRATIATTVLREIGHVETINSQSIRVIERDANNDVIACSGTVSKPTDGGTGYAVGCEYIDTNAAAGAQIYRNEGTNTVCSFQLAGSAANLIDGVTAGDGIDGGGTEGTVSVAVDVSDLVGNGIEDDGSNNFRINEGFIQYAEIDLTEANILAMNGAPVEVVAGQAGKVVEFLGAALFCDFDTAAYTDGGDVSIIEEDGSDVSTVAAAADSFGSATDESNILKPLAASYQPVPGKGLMITNGTGAFTDPGTAAGVGRVKVAYRVHTTGL
jgi:hypothetical protein